MALEEDVSIPPDTICGVCILDFLRISMYLAVRRIEQKLSGKPDFVFHISCASFTFACAVSEVKGGIS